MVPTIIRIFTVPPKVFHHEGQIVGVDVLLPPGGLVRDFVVLIPKDLLEPRAEPLLLLVFNVPVPDAVQRAPLQEIED